MISPKFYELDQEIRKCTRCAMVLNTHPENPPISTNRVHPRPILSEPMRAKVMLIGQAPGLTEYQTGRPFSGQAGGGIRQLFSECGITPRDFDQIVFQTSAVKCFPGRKRNKERWEDRPPCGEMRRSCSDFLKRQIDIIQPSLIVTLGAVAAEALDKIRALPRRTLSDVLGTSEKWQDIVIVKLAHTSGGSRFLNNPINRAKQQRAKAALSSELAAFALLS
jgi:uracil-DNA glycosylase